jgi:ATP-binding cassette subfamily F protein 3
MLLLSCSRLSRGFDDGPLFEDIGFELYAGERVGLVGPNGVGKTTLLRLLAGHDRPDDGEVRLHAGARIALLQQQPDFQKGRALFDEAKSALDQLLAAHDDMVKTAERLAQATDEAERKTLAARYDRLHELLHHHDAYNVDHRVENVLDGLGLAEEDYRRPVETFSGGQQSRLMLAKLLLAAPDVMLLDEPNNHLDIAATRWLEDYLAAQHEAMLIVSHDRYFLNRVVNKVFELSPRGMAAYPGNFEAYNKLREARYEQELKAWEAQREYIAKQEEYIRRVHYGQLHKQAHSRQKALDKLERVERPTLISAPHMNFGEVQRSGDVVFQVSDLCKAYDKPLFRDLSFQLQRGQRLGIMGPNGSGKTTLLRVLLGQEKPDSGKAEIGHLVEFGYYDQHLKILPEDKEVIRAVWPHTDEQTTDQQRRDLLARFGLVGDQVYQKVGELSGGERSRVALARVVALGTNVLVLDEPTNHLDLWACESLEKALLEFEGTSIVVSHDRWFLNRVVDLLLVLEGGGRVRVIPGNYDTYELLRAQQIDNKDRSAAKVDDKKTEKPKPERETRKKKRRFPYRKVEDLEAEIAKEETVLRGLEQKMASPDLYRDGDKVKETTQAFEAVKVRLQQLYEHWEEAVELN